MNTNVGRPRIHNSNADRVKAHRAKHGLKSFTVELDEETFEGLERYRQFRDESRSAVISRLIKTQLLRRR